MTEKPLFCFKVVVHLTTYESKKQLSLWHYIINIQLTFSLTLLSMIFLYFDDLLDKSHYFLWKDKRNEYPLLIENKRFWMFFRLFL